MSVEKELKEAKARAKDGRPTRVSVRDFLWWWEAQRRTHWNVVFIRKDLKKHGLKTVPDFEETYLDADIEIKLVDSEVQTANERDRPSQDFKADDISDPTYRVSKLAAANRGVVSAKPNDSLEQIVTLMMEKDFSQVPVMTSSREVKGIISWRSIGTRLAVANRKAEAKDYMEPAFEIRHSDSMFDLIGMIVQRDFVLVRDRENKVSGIITGSDLSEQFQQISEPFLLLSEIENLLRLIIEDRFNLEELQQCKNDDDLGREVNSVADLNFGEYIRLLENEERWKKFEVAIDRVAFCKGLDDVRRIRNDVMHFDPDGVPPEDLERLRDHTKFLRRLHNLLMH